MYGSDDAKADALRTHAGGLLKTSPGNLLPFNNSTYFTTPLDMANDAMQVPNDQLFAAGDRRGNENIELTALQTLFVREHNRLATLLHSQHPLWTDEQLYQEARKLNIAEEEIITYQEWIPAILGSNALPAYNGYKANVDPTIASEFSTVAFRFGHSLLSDTIGRDQNDGLGIDDVSPDGSGVDLAQDFFDPYLIDPTGAVDPLTGHTASDIGPILKADADNTAQEMDVLAIRQVRNLLFGPEGAGGEDLIARDIQRARDHGLPDYNTLRAAYHLPPVTSFSQITSNSAVQQELRAAYGTLPDGQDNVASIDAFEGAVAEDHVAGADVGPLIKAVLVDQFTRLRDGDRFFYQNESFTPSELQILLGTSLARVIEHNTPITNLQSNVFFFKASIRGTVYFDADGDGVRDSNEPGFPGVIVQLRDESGNVIARTVTGPFGNYFFNEQTGIPGTGQFTVSIVTSPFLYQTSPDPDEILISRGDLNQGGADFGVNFVSTDSGNVPTNGSLSLLPASSVGAGLAAGPTAPNQAAAAEPGQVALPDRPQSPGASQAGQDAGSAVHRAQQPVAGDIALPDNLATDALFAQP